MKDHNSQKEEQVSRGDSEKKKPGLSKLSYEIKPCGWKSTSLYQGEAFGYFSGWQVEQTSFKVPKSKNSIDDVVGAKKECMFHNGNNRATITKLTCCRKKFCNVMDETNS